MDEEITVGGARPGDGERLVTPDDHTLPPEPTPGLVPAWLENLAAFGWRILAVVGLAVVLAWIALTLISVTASLVLSAVIAAAVAPLVISLRGRGWPRVRAALAGWAVAGGIIVVALALIVVAFVPAIREVVGALQAGLDALRSGTGGVRLPPELASTADQASAAITGWVKDDLGELAGRVSMTATIAILSTFLTFFVLLDADHGADWALQGVDPADRDALRLRGRDAALRVGGLVRSTAVASAVRAGVMLVAMLALGTPFAGPLAATLLVAGLIPYLGALVAYLLVVLVALGGQGLGPALLVLVASAAVEVALTYGRGRLEGSAAFRVHPAVALLALPVGAIAAGLIGMIVAAQVAEDHAAPPHDLARALRVVDGRGHARRARMGEQQLRRRGRTHDGRHHLRPLPPVLLPGDRGPGRVALRRVDPRERPVRGDAG